MDATAGVKSIWHPKNKDRDDVLYIDKREEESGFWGEGRNEEIQPDEIQDFRDLPYKNNFFNLVVFDPPHYVDKNGMERLEGLMKEKYGALRAETWQHDIRKGFEELWRVLSPGGTLVFKFADTDIDFDKVLDLAPCPPMLGTTTKKNQNTETRWFVFYKSKGANEKSE